MKKQVTDNKVMSLFDHLNSITYDKKPWSSLGESDRKTFSPFMINRFLSMDLSLTELVNFFQRYTIGILSPRDTYKLYSSFLPKKKYYFKYVKGNKDDKYEKELVDLMCKHYLISSSEAIDYLNIHFMNMKGIEMLVQLLESYGYDEKRIKKLLK